MTTRDQFSLCGITREELEASLCNKTSWTGSWKCSLPAGHDGRCNYDKRNA